MHFSRRLIIPGIVVGLALIVIIGFIIIKKNSFTGSNPMKAIPIDASFICKINDFKGLANSLTSGNKLWKEMTPLPAIKELTFKILLLDSLSNANSTLNEILTKSTTLISQHNIGGRRNEFLFIINLQSEISIKSLIGIPADFNSQNIEKSERKYEGETIYTFSTSKSNKEQLYYFTVIDGNIIFSESIILIEKSIRQIQLSKSLLDDTEFEKVLSTTGKNKNANFYLNLNRISGLIAANSSPEFQKRLKDYSAFGGWSELDLNISTNKIILNGFMIANSKNELFINIFDGSKSIKFMCDQILPSTVSAFVSINIDNINLKKKSYLNYLSKIDKKSSYEKNLAEVEKSFGFKADELFISMIENEITVAKIHSGNSQQEQYTIVTVKCKSGNQSRKLLDKIVLQTARKKGIDLQSFKSKYTFDDESQFDIIEFPVKNITGLVFGGLFAINNKTYYTQIGNNVVFADSKDALGYVISSHILNKTLATNEIYKNFSQNIDDKSHLLFYTDLSRSSEVFSEYLDKKIIKTWENNNAVFQKVRPFGIQITNLNNKPYCNILLQCVDDLKAKPQTVWESLLDTTCQFKPQLMVNHYTKENEIFIQDLNNTIYLINKSGRIIWKQNLQEKINSRIYQIDYFNNGKLQILFSTANYLHLLDRNGNYVERYPVRLRAAASTGMSLFDYDGDKNYRILIPCFDNKIYTYTKEGTLVSGWNFAGSDYPIGQPVSHFRVGDKDYIVAGDKYHTYILDRKGEPRIAVNEEILKSENNNYILDEAKSRILITDTIGNIVSIFFDGKVEKVSLGEFSPKHFFDFKDINADGEKDYLFLDGGNLNLYRQNKTKIYTYTFKNPIQERPIYYIFSYSDRKLGIIDAIEEKIYLLNNNGSVYKDFPLEGTTMFSIGYLEATGGKFNLIVGGRNNFLYNYSVQ